MRGVHGEDERGESAHREEHHIGVGHAIGEGEHDRHHAARREHLLLVLLLRTVVVGNQNVVIAQPVQAPRRINYTSSPPPSPTNHIDDEHRQTVAHFAAFFRHAHHARKHSVAALHQRRDADVDQTDALRQRELVLWIIMNH